MMEYKDRDTGFYEPTKGSGGASDVNINKTPALPMDLNYRYSETFQTHNAASVGAGANTTRVEVNTKGYSKAVIMHNATGGCRAYADAVMSNGTLITDKIGDTASTASALKATKVFELNGLEKISVWGIDTSGASNAITIEVSLMV